MYDNGIVGNNVYTCHNYETLNNHFNSTQWNGQKKILNRWPSKKVIVPNVKNIKKIELSVAIESEIVNPRWHLFTFNCIVFCRDKHTTSLIYILWFTSYGSKTVISRLKRYWYLSFIYFIVFEKTQIPSVNFRTVIRHSNFIHVATLSCHLSHNSL